MKESINLNQGILELQICRQMHGIFYEALLSFFSESRFSDLILVEWLIFSQ